MPTPNLLSKRLTQFQTFRETTWGTPGAATARWMALRTYPTLTPFRKSAQYDEARGSLAPGFNHAILQNGGSWKVPGYLTYQDAIFLGHAIWGIVTPTGSNPYTYTYNGPNNAQNNLQSWTIEFAQASALARAQGAVANKLSLKGKAASWWEYDLSGWAQDIDPAWSGSLASLSDRTVEICTFPVTALWMDASGGTIGSTTFANTMVEAGLDIENGAEAIPAAGALAPQNWVIGSNWKTSLTLKLLYTSAVRTFINNTLMAGTRALIRLRPVSGAAQITFDFAGVLTEDPELYGEEKGAKAIQVKLSGEYDSGAALYTNMTVVNAVSSIP